MIVGFSTHHGAGDDGAVGVIDYLLSPQPGRGGAARARPMRDPVPELLVGNPRIFAAAVNALPSQNRYRSAVLSFAASDVDPEAFNRGDLGARAMVSGCLDLFQEVMFPGIPVPARPHLIIGTHTHVGRLEINVAVPQAVRRPDGRFRAWNPEPPGTHARDLWRAYQDMVNLRYGFADPFDPARRQLMAGPNWRRKRAAEAKRSDGGDKIDEVDCLIDRVIGLGRAGALRDRSGVIGCFDKIGEGLGWRVISADDATVTIGTGAAGPDQRVRLRGVLCQHDFAAVHLAPPSPEAIAARRAELTAAPDRLATAWARVAAFNCARYGQGAWPIPTLDLAGWLSDPKPRTRIPQRHPHCPAGARPHENANADPDGIRPVASRDPDAPRSSARARGTDARADGDAGPHRYARPPHRGPGGGDLGAGPPLGHLAAANHLTRVVTTLTTAIAWLARHTSSLVALRHVDTLIPDTLVRSLSDLTRKMETCHAVLTSWRAGAATDRGTNLGPARSIAPIGAFDRTSDGIAVGRLGHDRRGGGAARATDSAAYGGLGWSPSDRRGAERGDEPVGRDGADRRAAERDRVAADGARREPAGDVGGVAADRELDAGGGLTPAPVGSRIWLLTRVRAAVIAAHPGATLAIRPVSAENDPLHLDVGISGAGSLRVSMTAVQPEKVEDVSLLRKISRAVADALGLVRDAAVKQKMKEPRAVAMRERILILADTEIAARQVETIMARAPRFEPIIRPAMSLSKPENIGKIVDALLRGNVTACVLASPRPDGVRTEIREGWVDLVRAVGPGTRCEIREIDDRGQFARCAPSWATATIAPDQRIERLAQDDPEDPTPGG